MLVTETTCFPVTGSIGPVLGALSLMELALGRLRGKLAVPAGYGLHKTIRRRLAELFCRRAGKRYPDGGRCSARNSGRACDCRRIQPGGNSVGRAADSR